MKVMVDGTKQQLLRKIALAKEAYDFLDKSSVWRQNAEKVHLISTLVCTLIMQFLNLCKRHCNDFSDHAQAICSLSKT